MSIPPDHNGFDLVPNDDKDPQREEAATKAVQAAIIRLAQQHGLTVHTDPGAIEPDAVENPERAEQIERRVQPKLIESTAAFHKEETVEEEYREDGSLIRRKVNKIVAGHAKLDASLGELHSLLSKIYDGAGAAFEIACKVVNFVREKIPSRKR